MQNSTIRGKYWLFICKVHNNPTGKYQFSFAFIRFFLSRIQINNPGHYNENALNISGTNRPIKGCHITGRHYNLMIYLKMGAYPIKPAQWAVKYSGHTDPIKSISRQQNILAWILVPKSIKDPVKIETSSRSRNLRPLSTPFLCQLFHFYFFFFKRRRSYHSLIKKCRLDFIQQLDWLVRQSKH